MKDLVIRFIIGGFVVSLFSVISDLFKPKTFAGLFGAAPSVALASLVLTALKHSKEMAAVEARSMIIGALALFIYATFVSYLLLYLLLKFRLPALWASLSSLLLWLAAAAGLWSLLLT
ncbi:MAG: hypothetical protein DMG97_19700 [Acidobacteria bacterium]|nr:MAG: hypothetical protein DMG97_19700 [Acidobacteriota bacterium]